MSHKENDKYYEAMLENCDCKNRQNGVFAPKNEVLCCDCGKKLLNILK